jgi:hypothetical protein
VVWFAVCLFTAGRLRCHLVKQPLPVASCSRYRRGWSRRWCGTVWPHAVAVALVDVVIYSWAEAPQSATKTQKQPHKPGVDPLAKLAAPAQCETAKQYSAHNHGAIAGHLAHVWCRWCRWCRYLSLYLASARGVLATTVRSGLCGTAVPGYA